MYKPQDYIKCYYIYDRRYGIIAKCRDKKQLFKHVIRLYKPFLWNIQDDLSSVETQQNFTNTDTTVHYEYVKSSNSAIKTFVINPFTFYYESFNGDIHVFDIRIFHDEILQYRYTSDHRNWCPKYKFKPYQKHHKHRKPNKYAHILDGDETDIYFKSMSQKKLGYTDNKIHYKDYTVIGKSWKEQTKRKHQYGNNSRNKYLESDFFKNIDNLEDTQET